MENDFTLVTGNSVDFRGSIPSIPGGLYALEALHAGLVCLNSEQGGLDRNKQIAAFEYVLEELPADLVNRAIEVTVHEDGSFSLTEYAIPNT